MLEGAAIAIDSLRANKVRAALTILGVAIGVTVVIAMGSAITGINRSITAILESAGPKTFYVFRYFSGGLEVSDGSDELSPWRRMPELTVDEAELIRALPGVREVNIGEYAAGPVSSGDVSLHSVDMAGLQSQLAPGERRRNPGGPQLHPGGVRRRRSGGRDQRQAGGVALSRPGPGRKADQDLRPAVRGGRDARGSRVAVRQRRRAAAGDTAHHVHQGGGLLAGVAGDRGDAHRDGDRGGGAGRGDGGPSQQARAAARARRTTSPW